MQRLITCPMVCPQLPIGVEYLNDEVVVEGSAVHASRITIHEVPDESVHRVAMKIPTVGK
jgi:hypothetical protein